MSEKKAPRIRFKGFEDDWGQERLGDVVDIGSGMDYKHLSEGDIPVYGTGGYMLSVNKALSYDHDAIGIGRKGTIDKPYILKAPFWTVDTLFFCIPKAEYNLNFVSCLFQNINWKSKDESTGVPSLSKTTIGNVDVRICCPEEQAEIGSFFANIDSLLSLHQRKLDKLKTIKESMLENCFPKDGEKVPRIRFSGFTGDWEQRKLSSMILDIADGPFGSDLKREHYTEKKEARIIQLSNLSDYGWQEENTRYTTFKHARKLQRCIVNKDEMVMGKMMPAGMTILRPNSEKMYVLSSDCVRIKLDSNSITNLFFLYTTKSPSFLDQVSTDTQGSTRVRTSISKIKR